ncbi:MAG: 4Fe-4S binding protein [Defluviitaleaceae bacterium]|nr:4Fe-4S binding protein [Defluviitaleaceae bacterium]
MKQSTLSFLIRPLIQTAFFFAQNPFLGNFLTGRIHDGDSKGFCTPGLNCYSCPAAAFSCPIGTLQNFFRGAVTDISFAVVGFLVAVSAMFGRFICGYVCPMGFLQDILHKTPLPKLRVRLKYLSYLRYVILALFVVILPIAVSDYFSQNGETWFCAYICPSGTIFGAVPLLAHPSNAPLRDMLGGVFIQKAVIAIAIVLTSMFIYRIFCRLLCPLGAIYSIFNKISFIRINFAESRCTSCRKCDKACHVNLSPITDTTSHDCMRCGSCVRSCPTDALKYGTLITKRTDSTNAS